MWELIELFKMDQTTDKSEWVVINHKFKKNI